MDEALLQRLRAAFPPGTPPPRPVTGHRCCECDETDQLLGGRLWTDVADDFPQYCHDTYPLLTPAAKLYYLPAYLTYAVRNPGMVAGMSVQMALERGELQPGQFTAEQRAVLWSWVEEYYRHEPGGEPPDSVGEAWLLYEE